MGCRACEKPNVKYKKGLWSPDEDQRLRDYVLRHGLSCWSAVPAKAGLQRNGKSCRLRWINYLRPGLKRGNFSREEEEVVIKLQAKLGNKWSQIAMQLPGRTDNEVKNYWNSYLKKKIIKPQEHDQIPSSSTTSSSSSDSSSLPTQLLIKREEEPSNSRTVSPTIVKQGETGAAVNHCNLPRVLFGDWLNNFNGGGDQGGLLNLDEVMSITMSTPHGPSPASSSKLELHDQDSVAGFIDGFDEMCEVPESNVLFDSIFPWCDDL